MFDKNELKEAFRVWVLSHPDATESEARAFCVEQIPANVCLQYHWLVEQCVEWFQWLKARPVLEDDEQEDDDDVLSVC